MLFGAELERFCSPRHACWLWRRGKLRIGLGFGSYFATLVCTYILDLVRFGRFCLCGIFTFWDGGLSVVSSSLSLLSPGWISSLIDGSLKIVCVCVFSVYCSLRACGWRDGRTGGRVETGPGGRLEAGRGQGEAGRTGRQDMPACPFVAWDTGLTTASPSPSSLLLLLLPACTCLLLPALSPAHCMPACLFVSHLSACHHLYFPFLYLHLHCLPLTHTPATSLYLLFSTYHAHCLHGFTVCIFVFLGSFPKMKQALFGETL